MKIILIISLLLMLETECYKILGLFPLNTVSHFRVYESIMKELAKKGHAVTVISYFPQEKPITNYEDISLKTNIPTLTNSSNVSVRTQSVYERILEVLLMLELGEHCCKVGLSTPSIKEFINSNRKFDLIVAEFFISECFLGFAHLYRAPVVGITSSGLWHWYNDKIGNPSNPSYIPNILLSASDRKTFQERAEAILLNHIHQVFYNSSVDIENQEIAHDAFGRDFPPLYKIWENVSLILTNSHFTITGAKPLVPGLVEIGGAHIGRVKRLPRHIDEWVNKSAHGVVYFNMGSMIKLCSFPEVKMQSLLKAIGRIPQRILMKWENDEAPGKAENVMTEKWLPQLDVLCHPNVKAFISHGGMLGIIEAVHCSVPMILIPQFSDEFSNARLVADRGGGIVLDYHHIDEKSTYNALKTVLDPSFDVKVKELSARFKDRPLPPLDTAIYWIEYVARHGGALHLRTAAIGQPLYQYLLLDVLEFLLVVSFICVFVVWSASRTVFRILERLLFHKK